MLYKAGTCTYVKEQNIYLYKGRFPLTVKGFQTSYLAWLCQSKNDYILDV